MKKIVLACGAGAATSTLVAQKVATMLDANGYADKYEIAYECWEEMELDMESGESVPVAFWYSDPAKYTPGMKKIDHFEEGKFYMYSVELRLKGDNTVADDCNMNVNGH